MSGCATQAAGLVELYFYDELSAAERDYMARHLAACPECRGALAELGLIRTALAERPQVSAPPGGDWSALMVRIDRALAVEPARPVPSRIAPAASIAPRRPIAALAATAAAVALVSGALFYQGLDRRRTGGEAGRPLATVAHDPAPAPAATGPDLVSTAAAVGQDAGLTAVSEEHFERSKLVILGLANRDAESVSPADWAYERKLAGTLLDDTRLYKQTAEARGLGALAGVMSDLELVLLQTSLTDEPDAATLNRLQRLIRQRDLVSKMARRF